LVGPPVVVLVLVALVSAVRPFDVPTDSYLTVLLTATGATTAFGALSFSYARAAKDEPSHGAGLQAGRLFLAATVMLAVALGASFFEAAPSAPITRAHRVLTWLGDESARLGLRFGPALAALAVLRLYVHILRLAWRQMREFKRANDLARAEFA